MKKLLFLFLLTTALGYAQFVMPGVTFNGQATITNPVIASGLTASGSVANDFSGSTGPFKTSTGVWESPVMHIRCKASTTITIGTTTGTFTGVTYTAEGVIKQMN